MQIAVLIKQVPGTTHVEIDPDTGTLRRDGVAAKMNPYDLFALEEALRLKEKHGASVTVVTMGPPQAASVAEEALCMGVDGAYVLSDRKFAGADVLATGRTLARGLQIVAKREGFSHFDLILCGKQTTDGDTAQVGPEVAQQLGLPHVANLTRIREVTDARVTVDADMGEYEMTVALPLPALCTVDKDVNTPRLPSVRRRYERRDAGAPGAVILTFADYEGADEKESGLGGSPTRGERIFPPDVNR
ncbi:MAG: electron transfer flavoprotein subunit beta/FixA family protein, partial [Clostridia bacterium]|nr:electron transfer flavoprotein subunit beta/FixA family protein [Clostridia bacterium]